MLSEVEKNCPNAFSDYGKPNCIQSCQSEIQVCGYSPTYCNDYCEDKRTNTPHGGYTNQTTINCVKSNIHNNNHYVFFKYFEILLWCLKLLVCVYI